MGRVSVDAEGCKDFDFEGSVLSTSNALNLETIALSTEIWGFLHTCLEHRLQTSF